MIWVDTLVQGILLGGLYALFAAGLSLVFGIMRLGQPRPWRSDRLRRLSCVDGRRRCSACRPGSPRSIAMPLMFGLGWLLQIGGAEPGARQGHPAAAARHLRPLGRACRTVCSRPSRPIAAAFPPAALEGASLDLGLVTVGVMPLLTFASAIAVIVALNGLFYHTALGRAFRATSDDAVTAGLMGIEPKRIFAIATGIAMVVVTIAALYLGMRSNFDPSIGPARLIYAFEAVIIGGLGSLWGTLAGGDHHRRGADGWRGRQPRMADPGRPRRLSCRDAAQAAGPFPARRGLRACMYRLTTRTRAGTATARRRAHPGGGRGRVAGLRLAQRDPGPVLHPDHADAGAALEPARRLWRPGIGRPAGVRRHRRLCDVCRRHPARLESCLGDPAWRPRGAAARCPDCLLRLPPARRLFRHRHLGDRRGDPPAGRAVEGARRRHRHLAAARGDAQHSRHGRDPGAVWRPRGGRARHPRLLAGAGAGRCSSLAASTGCCAAASAWRSPPCATMSRRRSRSASIPGGSNGRSS